MCCIHYNVTSSNAHSDVLNCLLVFQLTHGIKLYPNRSAPSADPSSYMNTTVPIVSEKYDEVVFTNPKVEFHNILLSANRGKMEYPLSNETANLEYFRTYGDEEDVQRMLAAKKILEGELRNVRDRLLKADNELDEIKTSLTLVKSAIGENTKPAASTTGTKSASKTTEGNKTKVSDSKPKARKKASVAGEQGPAKKAKTETGMADSAKNINEMKKEEPAKLLEASKVPALLSTL